MQITIFLVSLFALAARVVHGAMPPACLLAAVNTQNNPADLSAVCGSNNATSVQSAIAALCSSNASAAQSAFIATCSSAGVQVASYTATGTATGSSASRTGSASTITGTAAAAGSSSQTGSSAGATSSAGAAQPKMGGYAAAAIALVGAVAAL